MGQMELHLGQPRAEPLELLLGFFDIVEGNAANRNFQETLDILLGHRAADLPIIGRQAFPDGLEDRFLGFLGFDPLVDPLFDEDALQGAGVDFVQQLALFYLQLPAQDAQEGGAVVADYLGSAGHHGLAVLDDQAVDRNALFALGERVKGVDDLLGVDAPLESDFDLHLIGGVVRNRGDLQLSRAGGVLHAGDEAFGGGGKGYFPDDDLLGIRGVQAGPHPYLSVPVPVFRQIHRAPGEKVGKDFELFALKTGDFGLYHLHRIVGQDLGAHAYGDALGPGEKDHREFGGEKQGFPVAPVIGIGVVGDLGIIENILGEGGSLAFDIPAGGGFVAGENVAEISLLVHEKLFVGQDHQGRADGLVAVGVVLHAMPDDIGHLVELAVVHFEEGVQNAPLDRLKPVLQIGDSPVLDDVGSVVEEVVVEDFLYVGHCPLLKLRHQVLHYEIPALRRVLAHEEAQEFRNSRKNLDIHLDDPHVQADEAAELLGTYLAQALEAGHFRGDAQGLYSLVPFPGVVAIPGFLLGPHPEQGSFKDEHPPLGDQFLEIGEEESQKQISDMEAVIVGVGGDDDLGVAQVFHLVLYPQGHHEVVQLLVLVDGALALAVHVLHLAPQGKDSLGVDVPGGNHGAGGGLALGEKDHGKLPPGAVAQVELAVPQIGDLEFDLPGRFLGFLLDHVEFGAQLFAGHDFFLKFLGGGRVLAQKLVHPPLHLLEYPGTDLRVAQLVLGLALEKRILELYGHRGGHALPHVLALPGSLEIFVDRLIEALPEGREMGAAVGGELAVHEGKVFLPVIVGVGEGELDAIAPVPPQIVEGDLPHFGGEKIHESLVSLVLGAVEHDAEPGVEAGVGPHPFFQELHGVFVFRKNLGVGGEFHQKSVFLPARGIFPGVFKLAPLEIGFEEPPIPVGDDPEAGGKGVHRLGAHPVQAHGELEHLVVVLGARIDGGDAVDDLAQGNAPAVVPDPDRAVLYGHQDFVARSHDELVHRVVDHFLYQNVDAVVGVGAVPQPPDVHTRPEPYMLEGGKRLYFRFVVD
ncbi:hypothetical protein SDC9_04513 [bioreactor metagenome]|uniref:Uncharacterized protein n=1 Tax=bioreactor metagenome TaxID=1076179 RepID=A0A644SXJ3_9ZZZZ